MKIALILQFLIFYFYFYFSFIIHFPIFGSWNDVIRDEVQDIENNSYFFFFKFVRKFLM